MAPQLFGTEHILYILITAFAATAALLAGKKLAKSQRAQTYFLRSLAFFLLISIVVNRLSQVFRYDTVRWYCLIPDSFCGMTSLVLALSVLLGKRDNVTALEAIKTQTLPGCNISYEMFSAEKDGVENHYATYLMDFPDSRICAWVVITATPSYMTKNRETLHNIACTLSSAE